MYTGGVPAVHAGRFVTEGAVCAQKPSTERVLFKGVTHLVGAAPLVST